jgi:hypothetical protein
MSTKSVPGDGTHAAGTKGGALEWFPILEGERARRGPIRLRDLPRRLVRGVRAARSAAGRD